MAKVKKTKEYICANCSDVFSRWEGKCPTCREWNSLEERQISISNSIAFSGSTSSKMERMEPMANFDAQLPKRIHTGIDDFDLVVGGGVVEGSFILLAGEPGVGKSTLLLEICRKPAVKVFYFTSEESQSQVGLRARRMGIDLNQLYLARESSPEIIVSRMQKEKPGLVLVDSIQTLFSPGNNQLPGMTGQLKSSAMTLLEAAKSFQIPVIVSGHITKDGNVAGPKMLEHMVDTVLYFESDRLNHYRMLRAIKNRFGPVGEVAIFEMMPKGLLSVDVNTIDSRGTHPKNSPGRVISVVREGTRSIVVEVQSLVSRCPYGPARRMAEGLDSKRVVLMAAVIEKFLKYRLAECDIFTNLTGGLDAHEPALDLSICAAIMSSYQELAVAPLTAFIGEVGLSGEVRPVARISSRVMELDRIGYNTVICSKLDLNKLNDLHNIRVVGVAHVSEVPALLFNNPENN